MTTRDRIIFFILTVILAIGLYMALAGNASGANFPVPVLADAPMRLHHDSGYVAQGAPANATARESNKTPAPKAGTFAAGNSISIATTETCTNPNRVLQAWKEVRRVPESTRTTAQTNRANTTAARLSLSNSFPTLPSAAPLALASRPALPSARGGSNYDQVTITSRVTGHHAETKKPCSGPCEATEKHEKTLFLDAIERVESNGNPHAIGDRGRARGLYQFWSVAWKETSISRARAGRPVFPYHIGATNPAIARSYAESYLGTLHASLTRALRRNPTHAELYAAYNMGFTAFRRTGFSLNRCPASTQAAAVKINAVMKLN